MRVFVALLGILIFGLAALAQPEQLVYVIVTDAKPDVAKDPYEVAVQELAKLRDVKTILRFGDDDLSTALRKLRTLKPDYVAFVVHPERIEDNFVGAVFEGLTKFNSNPFLDCAYGYITGATADDALYLVRNTAAAEAHPEAIPRKFAGIGHTFKENDLGPFATEQGKLYQAHGYQTVAINPKDDSPQWTAAADSEIQKLNGASLVFLAGHGMGDMSCAIHGAKFGGVKLQSALIVNGTCHSAVTLIRHDTTAMNLAIATRRIDPKDSVCLNFIKAGAIGQFCSTASSSWQNVAFAIAKFFDQGRSLGEALQESLNEKISAAGVKKVDIIPFRKGERSPQWLGDDQNPGGIQSFSRVILIGDPAYRPFPKAGVVATREARPEQKPDRTPDGKPEEVIDPRVWAVVERVGPPTDQQAGDQYQAFLELTQMGEAAVPAIIKGMELYPNWYFPKALGIIGDKRAIGPLIDTLERANWPPMNDVTAEALQILTGQNFGTSPQAWRNWWRSQQGRGR